ncbi:hypothetical protein FIBSPDRAFT_864635 [Athelia psychrophila]|uniref:Uncharacterized protein n=1 Tax=Athelia psychrophila TaxID=1759441 RepID=A0A166GAZ2_9AGAM|nr:hypothetical protein FIBSPDRAFT_864635 [Fibularhizoctonia sp. CBS 109695]
MCITRAISPYGRGKAECASQAEHECSQNIINDKLCMQAICGNLQAQLKCID